MKLCLVSFGPWSEAILRGETSAAGGSEAQVAYLARSLASIGHRVDLIYGDNSSNAGGHIIDGVRCVNAFPSLNKPGSMIKFWKALEASEADLIYTRIAHDFLWLIGLFVRRYPQSKYIYALANDRHCNPWHTYPWKGWFHNTLYAFGMRTANYVAVQHEAQAQLVRPYLTHRQKIVHIPNIIRSSQNEPRRFEDTTIDAIWVAHVRPQKQLSVFLDIAEQLPALKFVVVGGFGREAERSELERRMKGIPNLKYEGPLPYESVIQLLRSSKVLVNTSCWEGFPNTMLDAWCTGVPVVSLQIDPSGVIAREGLGMVSSTQNQLACDITKLVEERQLNCAMGMKGLEYIQKVHSADAVCSAFEQIIPGFREQPVAVKELTE